MSAEPLDITKYKGRTMTDQEAKELKKARSEFHRLLRKVCTPTEYTIFCSLEDRASDANDGWCWPSHNTIAEDCNVKRRTVVSAIANLVGYGLLETKDEIGKVTTYKPAKVTSEIIAHLSNLCKICTPTCAKNAQPPVQILHTNDTNRTIPIERETLAKANGAKAPLPDDISPPIEQVKTETKPIYQRYREKYESVKDDHKLRSGVIADCWQEITGHPPSFSFLNSLAKEFGSGWKVIEGILKMAGRDVVDRPEGYLREILSGSKSNGKPATNYATNGKTTSFPRTQPEPASTGKWSAATIAAANGAKPRPNRTD